MNPASAAPSAAARHWRASRRLAAGLALVWLAVWLLPLLFPRQLGFGFFGAPFVTWVCSQGAPLVFVLIVWRYQRGLERLERQREDTRAD